MRLSLSINDCDAIRASLQANGLLSAHLNLEKKPGCEETTGSVSLNAIDETDEPNTVYSTWEVGTLSVGDRVEIRVLTDGDADPPTKVRRTSESPKNLFSSAEQARLVLAAISKCDTELRGVVERARESEPADEFQKIVRAVGRLPSTQIAT